MTVLIFTVPRDFHAEVVCWGLKQLGVDLEKIYLPDIPQRESLTYFLDSPEEMELRPSGRKIRFSSYRTIWFRRMGGMVPRSDLHVADRPFVSRDWRVIQGFIEHGLESGGFCVNPPSAANRADLKPYQLRAARACGLRVPCTLISNEPGRIRAFIEANTARGLQTILKPLGGPAMWKTPEGRDIGLGTQIVTGEDLDASDAASGPNIYQPRIEKAYEVRVTIMGETMIAARLDTQGHAATHVDFRRLKDWKALACDPIDIPAAVAEALLNLCKRLAIVFASVDFVVDHQDEWIFLEVNEMGNFLWVEQVNPEIPLLDCFVRFLAEGRADFRYEPRGKDRLNFDHYRNQVFDADAYAREQDGHIMPLDGMSAIER